MPSLYMPGDKLVFNLSSLADHDTYAFAAYASNYAGDGPYSAKVTESGKTNECHCILLPNII